VCSQALRQDGFTGGGGLREVSPTNAALDDYFHALNTNERFSQLHQVLLTKVRPRREWRDATAPRGLRGAGGEGAGCSGG
jgi:hypothetical protein